MKNILGLDLGTNSIGWSVVQSEVNEDGKEELKGISCAGSRIIPMDAATLGDFDKGNSKSQTAERTSFRGVRRLKERRLLRRQRLLRVLDLMGYLPEHFSQHLDRYGNFIDESEPKLAWRMGADGNQEFLFKDSFQEMLNDFRREHPDMVADGLKVPYDWTLYYLRKKALTQPVGKEELAWLLLAFNQKRGYHELRGEGEEEEPTKQVEYMSLRVVAVEDSGDRKGEELWYNVRLENGWIYRRSSATYLDWVGKTKDFIVTTSLDKSGNPQLDKDGNVKRSFSAPKPEDWTLLKKKTEADIDRSGESVGAFIYDHLLANPKQKVRGKLVHTVERKYYKNELIAILKAQSKYHTALQDRDLYARCIEALYPSNDSHRESISTRDFTYLLVEDILFYQRPLKSKKSLVADCPYESRVYIDPKTGERKAQALKVIPKSHPLYQEFRLWQFIKNLKIYSREGDADVTASFLPDEAAYVKLFDWMNDQKEIAQDTLLSKFFKVKKPSGKDSVIPYRWNFVEDKKYPGNETRYTIISRLTKCGSKALIDNEPFVLTLWQLLYSISDKQELRAALTTIASKYGLGVDFVDLFAKCPPFSADYGAYSYKAIRKLLSLMRMGKYWDVNDIDPHTRTRIETILNGEFDLTILDKVREKAVNLTAVEDFKGLPLWLACYVVYNRHSEARDVQKWNTPDDIDAYLAAFKQHSLRNPIVEQVILESLRTVRDIWRKVGHIDEIHLELGREMKNPADKRKQMTERINQNENANLRIKALLTEFLNPEYDIENVRPYSPSQQELLRIYEDGVLSSTDTPDDISDILKKFAASDPGKKPTAREVMCYKLWLDQKYVSPYTGATIPLSKLFTTAYQIEHVIPQSRYFDDSLSNKVICESEVNKLKNNQLGMEFIKDNHGRKVTLLYGKTVEVLSVEAYTQLVKNTYKQNPTKMKKLLMEDLPDGFIERQMNDSRYISRFVMGLLSNIVRECDDQGNYEPEATSKNLIACSGGVTDRLKREWGVNDVWNHIILKRFERMNDLSNTNLYTARSAEGHLIPSIPLDQSKGFNKKRIDHRHHAMDAIVIACATRNIVSYLNNESASSRARVKRADLQRLLCDKRKTDDQGNYTWQVRAPWTGFANDVLTTLQGIVISFKQNLRIINKATNHYSRYEDGVKTERAEQKGVNWAVRKPLHKDTVYAEINLRLIKPVKLADALANPSRIVDKPLKQRIQKLLAAGCTAKDIKAFFENNKADWSGVDLKKIEVYYFTKETSDRYFATRKPLDTSFDRKTIMTKVADTGIQKILLAYLEAKGGNPEVAFSPDGIEELNKTIAHYNIDARTGREVAHQPILKVRCYEKADKFAVGQTMSKGKKFVEAAKGTNLFFAIYGKEDGGRTYESIPLNVVVERLKQNLKPVPEVDASGNPLLFYLKPNDLVYLPTEDQRDVAHIDVEDVDKSRIYKMVSCTGERCFFVHHNIAKVIVDGVEYNKLNKVEMDIETKESIKAVCIPLSVNRIGEILI